MRRQPVATAAKPDAKWVEPTAEVRIANRGGLTAELVAGPYSKALSKHKAGCWVSVTYPLAPQSGGVQRTATVGRLHSIVRRQIRS